MKSFSKTAHELIIFIILFTLVATFSWGVWQQNWDTVFMVGLTLALISIPYVLARRFGIKFSRRFRMGLVLFFFSTVFLGEVNHYYDTYQWWDLILHIVAGFGITLFGFAVLKTIYSQSELRSVPLMSTVFAFSFTGMLLGLWEIYEFLSDTLKIGEGNMQPSGTDTMVDLIVGYIAAFVVCIFGYRYLRNNEHNFAAAEIEQTELGEE